MRKYLRICPFLFAFHNHSSFSDLLFFEESGKVSPWEGLEEVLFIQVDGEVLPLASGVDALDVEHRLLIGG